MNGPSATILATSRVRGCTFSYTKGGQSEERGGGKHLTSFEGLKKEKRKLMLIISRTGLTVQTV